MDLEPIHGSSASAQHLLTSDSLQITMSYQQTTQTENSFPARSSASTMYPLPRSQYDAQSQIPSAQNENLPMNALMGSFAGLGFAGANAATTAGATSQFYVTADGQFYCAPVPGVYPAAQGLSEVAGNNYGYPAAMPYLAPQAAYPHGYIPGYPMMPYTPGRGYYADSLHKEVPGLENRRGSYSTNESTPGTPFYGSLRDHGAQIAAVDRSPFGSTPSPRDIPGHGQLTVKPLPYKTIPIDVDIDALLAQEPAIPRAVPAVFTPRESMRTLDQSLSNPIYGNRNVYIRGLHPNTDDDTLAAFAARFGKVETSKAIIDTSTGACKG